MSMPRRTFLRGAGATLALPFLSYAQRAHAQVTVPKRLVVFVHPEGQLNHRLADLWTPPTRPDGGLDVSTRPMLDMLVPHQQKMVVIKGVDNLISPLFVPGNGHIGPGHTYLTAHLPQTAVDGSGNLRPRGSQAACAIGTPIMGPSIDHYLASRLGGPDALNLGLHNGRGGEYRAFYRVNRDANGANIPVDMQIDPVAIFNRYIAGLTGQMPSRRERFAAKRRNVLDTVKESFDALYGKLGREDRLRLEQHAQRITEHQATLSTVPPVQCAGLTQHLPPDFPTGSQPRTGNPSTQFERALSTAQIDNLVQMLACGARTVTTLVHDEYHAPPMPWLANEADIPANERSWFPISGTIWHSRVHRDAGSQADHPVLRHGFRFYGKQFKYLLDRMDEIIEPNGQSLLDNSLVLWISEFGDGGAHDTNNLPVVLAGGLQGALRTGRFLDMSVRTGQRTRYSVGDLHTSILHLFGFNETFGYTGSSGLNNGGIAGLVG